MIYEKIKELVKKGYELLKNLVTKLKKLFKKENVTNKEFAIDHGVYGYSSVENLNAKDVVIDYGVYGYSSVAKKDYVKNAEMTRKPNKVVNKQPVKLARTNVNELGMRL